MSRQAGQLSPRLGAVTDLGPNRLEGPVRLVLPGAQQLRKQLRLSGTQRANPDLRPETIKTWEGGVEHYLDSQTRLLATAYMYRLDKLIDQISESRTGLLQYVNSGKTRAHGIELEAERLWLSGVRLRTSLDLQHAHDNRGNDLSNSPRTSAKMNLSVPLP
jgi:iron complex outermembrane receptor protein